MGIESVIFAILRLAYYRGIWRTGRQGSREKEIRFERASERASERERERTTSFSHSERASERERAAHLIILGPSFAVDF